MSISITPRDDGKLVISCGDETIIYPSDPPWASVSAEDVKSPSTMGPDGKASSRSRPWRNDPPPGGGSPVHISFRPITQGGGGVICGLGSRRRLNRVGLKLVTNLDQFNEALAAAPLHRPFRIGWQASEPLQIAELRAVLQSRERIPPHIEIWPMASSSR